MRVLLVDDNAQLRRVMALYFAHYGIEIEGVEDGKSAIKFFAEGRTTDIVLLDFSMPRHDGLSVLPALRKACTVPIVLFTGSPNAVGIYADLFDGVVDKGATPDEILATLQRLAGEIT